MGKSSGETGTFLEFLADFGYQANEPSPAELVPIGGLTLSTKSFVLSRRAKKIRRRRWGRFLLSEGLSLGRLVRKKESLLLEEMFLAFSP